MRSLRKTRQTRQKAFTLIELLVVTAILSLLVSILIPSLTKAKEIAKRAVCASNMRHVTQALWMYISDNDERQPLYSCYETLGGGSPQNVNMEYLYFIALSPYTGIQGVTDQPVAGAAGGRMWHYTAGVMNRGPIRQSIMFCPSEKWQLNKSFDPDSSTSAPWCIYTNYGTVGFTWDGVAGKTRNNKGQLIRAQGEWGNVANVWNGGDTSMTVLSEFTKPHLSRLKNPASWGLFGHMTGEKAAYTMIVAATGSWASYSYDSKVNHLDDLPISFVDGHVETFTRTKILQDRYKLGKTDTPLWSKAKW